VKFLVMHFVHAAKHRLPAYRGVLRATADRILVEDGPRDGIWGGRDRSGGMNGENLLGVVLMEVRAELLDERRRG
jgi:predicted NAD-dependent protein-ADP-ribosyltransferase YbiA (DUF1768 family)